MRGRALALSCAHFARRRSRAYVYVSAWMSAYALEGASPRGKKKLCYRKSLKHVTVPRPAESSPPTRETLTAPPQVTAHLRHPCAARCVTHVLPAASPICCPLRHQATVHCVTEHRPDLVPALSLHELRASPYAHASARPCAQPLHRRTLLPYAAPRRPGPYPLPPYRPTPHLRLCGAGNRPSVALYPPPALRRHPQGAGSRRYMVRRRCCATPDRV